MRPKEKHLISGSKYITYELAHDKTYNKACVTSQCSAQPVRPPSTARVLVYRSLDSLNAAED